MSDGKVEKPEEVVQPGQKLELKILNVDPVERKIGLSLKTSPSSTPAEATPPAATPPDATPPAAEMPLLQQPVA